MPDLLIRALVGLLPVVLFLLALIYLDSYKLVGPRMVLAVIGLGAFVSGLSYLVNWWFLGQAQIEYASYSRYIAPVIEELLKAIVLIALIRASRIGFLVDAAIYGFAVGTGFAMVENLYYLGPLAGAPLAVWILRGFGTAIMHGGATAIFAIVAFSMIERHASARAWMMLPGLLPAIAIHSIFNHFFLSPVLSALGILLLLPPVIYLVFERSERAVENWLGVGFDADAELLELMNSGQFSSSPVGTYLHSLKEHFHGEVVADLLCYLRLHVELALRAKGLLMMRESGFDLGPGAEISEKFAEMEYLEKSIGKTGRLALQPFLHLRRKDLWQLHMLGK